MVRSHWPYRGKRGSVPKRAEARPSREANSRQKRGPATGKTPPWRAERRGHSGNGMLTHDKLERRLARHTLDISRAAKREGGLPGASNNTGDEACPSP
jgi:hypothetical protein